MKKSIIFIILFTASSLYGESDSNVKTLSWQECFIYTVRNHSELNSARENIVQSRSDRGITRSNLLPKIDADAKIGKSKSYGENDEGNNLYSYGLTSRQLLFDGLSSIYSYKKSGEDIDISRYNYLVAESNIIYNVRKAYIDLLKSRESVILSETILKRRKDNQKLVKMRYKAGREHLGSLMSAEADLESALYELRHSGRNATLNLKTLKSAMNFSGNTGIFDVEKDFSLRTDMEVNPDCEQLAMQVPLLMKMISLRKATLYDKKAAYGIFFPRVYAYLNFDSQKYRGAPQEKEIAAGVEVSLPLFEGGSRYYKTKKAESLYRQAAFDEESIKKSVIITLEKTWSALKDKNDMVTVQLKYLQAAKERARIAESQYSIGLISFDNWTIIEESLVTAMKKYLDARIELLLAEAEWIQTNGRLSLYEK